VGTLTIPRGGVQVPVWRDGALLDDETRRRALPLVAAQAEVRITGEFAGQPAGWDSLEQAIATLEAVYGSPLAWAYDGDAEELRVIFDRGQLELDLPELV
jgi:hypothetical protein